MRFVTAPVGRFFDVEGGNSKLTKKHMRAHPGEHPVYGATVGADTVIGRIDSADFLQDGLSFVRIGYAGHVALRRAPFSVTCNVFVLVPKGEVLDRLHLPYFVRVVSAALKDAAVGRPGKDGSHDYMQVTKGAALAATVPVPVDADGAPDVSAQEALAARYERISATKAELSETAKKLGRLRLALPLDGVATADVALSDAFDLTAGKGRYTRAYARSHPGEYPLYTAATQGADVDKIDTWDHDTEALHYTIQGANAGTVFHRSRHKFSMTGDAGILVRRTESIDYRFAYHAVSELFAAQGFRWASNTASKPKVLNLKLRLPVLPNGEPDLLAQQAIAARLDTKLKARSEIQDALRRLAEKDVVIGGGETGAGVEPLEAEAA